MKSREVMIKYLVRETYYTEAQLKKKTTKVLEKWYREEKECNRYDCYDNLSGRGVL